jgi:hypothetical protein
VLAIVSRELAQGDEGLRVEWRRLAVLLKTPEAEVPESGAVLVEAVRSLNEGLAERIRAGEADDGPWRTRVLAHLRATAEDRLAVANPRYMTPREGR